MGSGLRGLIHEASSLTCPLTGLVALRIQRVRVECSMVPVTYMVAIATITNSKVNESV